MTKRLEIQEVRDLIIDELSARDKKIEELEGKVALQDYRLNEYETKLKEYDTKLCKLESTYRVQDLYNKYLARQIDDLNQYQRRQNLLIDGLRIPRDAKDNTIRDIVFNHFKKINIDILEEDIVRAHRTGRSYRDKSGKMHTPILCRFVSWHPRNIAWENRKLGKGVFLKADLTECRNELLEALQRSLHNDERVKAVVKYIFADRNCRITVNSLDGRYFPVNTLEEFNLLLNYIESTLPPYDAIMKALYDDGIGNFQKVANIINLNDVDDPVEVTNEENVKYIGRAKGELAASKWQNPYSSSVYDLRTCLKLYNEHVINTPELMNDLDSLKGCSLACWCTDGNLCHGKILLDLLQ